MEIITDHIYEVWVVVLPAKTVFSVVLKTDTNVANVLVIFVVGGLHLFLGDIHCAQLGCAKAVHPYLFYTVHCSMLCKY